MNWRNTAPVLKGFQNNIIEFIPITSYLCGLLIGGSMMFDDIIFRSFMQLAGLCLQIPSLIVYRRRIRRQTKESQVLDRKHKKIESLLDDRIKLYQAGVEDLRRHLNERKPGIIGIKKTRTNKRTGSPK